jgi:putative ABC transport system permease protein
MVEEQRTQIGTLKALGYSKGAIFSEYLIYAGSASVLGCAVGALLGAYFLPKMIWQAYNIMYGFSQILWAFDWPLVLISSLAFIVCALAATWYACSQELSRPAAELMRPKSPKAGRRVFLERIPFLWNRIPFLHKVSIRNVLRYRKRMVMMAIGIGGCTALLLTGYGIRDSIENVVDYQYEEITKYDMSVNFRDGVDEAGQKTFLKGHADVLGSCLFVRQTSMDCTANGVTKTALASAAVGDSTKGFVDLHSKKTPVAYPKDGQCVLNQGLASALNLKVGDKLTLRDNQNHSVTLTVSGIFDNYVYNYVYITTETYASAFGAGSPKLALVCAKPGADLHKTAASLAKDGGVSNVQVNEDLRGRVANMMKSMNYIVLVVIVCAGALAFIVLYNLTNINITERLREIATIKVLGFYERETNSYVFRENIVLTLLGILVGYPMGIWLHSYVMSQIKIDMVAFDVRIAGVSYLYAAAFTVVFSLIVNFVMRFRIRAIDMAEALKSAE